MVDDRFRVVEPAAHVGLEKPRLVDAPIGDRGELADVTPHVVSVGVEACGLIVPRSRRVRQGGSRLPAQEIRFWGTDAPLAGSHSE
jgi:hypothetical protein